MIYKGPVAAETLLADLTLLGESRETLRESAIEFSGVWVGRAPFDGPKRYVSQLLDHAKLDDVEQYYQRYLTAARKLPNPPTGPMVEGLKTLAIMASQRKKFTEQVDYLEEAVALVAEAPDLRALLREARERAKEGAEHSLAALLEKVTTEPKNGKAYLALADAYRRNGEPEKAVENYKNALRNEPSLFVAAGKLAWILATHPLSLIHI